MDEPKVSHKGFLVDTNVVNAGLDGHVDFDELGRLHGQGYCTHLVERELAATADLARRGQLLNFYKTLGLEPIDSATAAAMTASSELAAIIWADVETLKAEVLARSDRPERARTIRNSQVDALHAEAAKRTGLTLATGDEALAGAASAAGIATTRVS